MIEEKVRLSAEEIDAIIQTVREVFGENIKLWLFGSRTYPNKKGGDIDLYLETKITDDILRKKLKFLVQLEDRIGEQKIDLILKPFGANDEISKVAKRQG